MAKGHMTVVTKKTGLPVRNKKLSTETLILYGKFNCHCGSQHQINVYCMKNGKFLHSEAQGKRFLDDKKTQMEADCLHKQKVKFSFF
jgi:hypothetical protein